MQPTPLIAIVGRPNVGKSTLFNRLVGSRRAIVGDEPGITRDRLYGKARWRGHDLRIVDTGGILPDDTDFIPSEIFRQARVALDEAAAIIMVVDARTELAAPDLELARLLQRTGKPLFLAANKIDSPKQESLADDLHRLGIRNIFPISAEHARGVEELLADVIAALPAKGLTTEDTETTEEFQDLKPRSSRSKRRLEDAADKRRQAKSNQEKATDQRPTTNDGLEADDRRPTTDDEPTVEEGSPTEVRVAIIGHPNVGKSTLLNRLTGAERSIVSPIPGTTRDAVDELVTRNGQNFRFIDTAGIRRKGKTHLMAEKLSVVMARKHLDAADIALLVIDATEGVSALDAAIAGYAHESGRSVIIIVNKWDLCGPGAFNRQKSGPSTDLSETESSSQKNKRRPHKQLPSDREAYEERLRDELKFLSYAPVMFVSAASGKGTDKIFLTLAQVAAERRKRVTTGQMNRFLKHIDFDRASVPMRQRVRILYLTQAAVSPPTFVLFTDRQVKLHFSYQRFLENQIRKEFGFVGSPIWIKVKARG
jgi:GTP-binding protein